MRIAITGATGYIGKGLANYARKRGMKVLSLSRTQNSFTAQEWIPYNLQQQEPPVLPSGISAVVHLATAGQLSSPAMAQQEVEATEKLITAATNAGALFIFVSSQTARADAPTLYGRSKAAIESIVLEAGGYVVRPGQVYGGTEQGLYGQLTSVARKSVVLPAFLPSPLIQPIHLEDLCEALVNLISIRPQSKILQIAQAKPVSFTYFLSQIAAVKAPERRILFIPVPTLLVRFAAGCLGNSLSTRLGIGRLLSLFDLPFMESASHLASVMVRPRPLRRGLKGGGVSGGGAKHHQDRRALLIEATAILGYVMRKHCAPVAGRHYVRAIEQLRDGRPLDLPWQGEALSIWLPFIDDPSLMGARNETQRREFFWRLDAATVMAEASPAGARQFIGLGHKHGMIAYGVQMIGALCRESASFLLRICTRPILRRLLVRANG
ncbi:NADH dehydrogenase [Silvimonas terrae]|uniref:NADH dehydrogenase n=1 Tax=Silvimonas terrae TaxID=300266 RepID=A0A840RHB6_9NEIS|nr:sugar nucleotide-binding protein [Silvimonas terrae]MBB5192467.1 NADH dehydrogenase [Silvimonas terrae]